MFAPKTEKEKRAQHMFFFWHKKEYRQRIKDKLLNSNRKNLADRLLGRQITKEVVELKPFAKFGRDNKKFTVGRKKNSFRRN
jgi:hypothetical protein